MLRRDPVRTGEVGDGARDPQHALAPTRAQRAALVRVPEGRLGLGPESGVLAEQARGHARVARDARPRQATHRGQDRRRPEVDRAAIQTVQQKAPAVEARDKEGQKS